MVCACAEGSWSSGKVSTNETDIAKVSEFLGMKSKYADDDSSGFYPNPKVTDTGVTGAATAANIASAAISALNTALAIKIAGKQYDIASSYYDIAKKKWDRFNQIYKPCEKAEMNEACNTPEYVVDYDAAAAEVDNEVTKDFGQMNNRMSQYFKLYCLCSDDSLARDFALSQQLMVDDSINYIYRSEEWRKIAKDDTRWNRRAQALNRGRNLESEAVSFAKAASNIYGNIGNEIGQAAQGAAEAFGYFSNRNATIYPQGRTGPSQSPSQVQVQQMAQALPDPNSGSFGFASDIPGTFSTAGNGSLSNYVNDTSPYSHNGAITSAVGSQTHSSTGG